MNSKFITSCHVFKGSVLTVAKIDFLTFFGLGQLEDTCPSPPQL